jgi:hypothetical protein
MHDRGTYVKYNTTAVASPLFDQSPDGGAELVLEGYLLKLNKYKRWQVWSSRSLPPLSKCFRVPLCCGVKSVETMVPPARRRVSRVLLLQAHGDERRPPRVRTDITEPDCIGAALRSRYEGVVALPSTASPHCIRCECALSP